MTTPSIRAASTVAASTMAASILCGDLLRGSRTAMSTAYVGRDARLLTTSGAPFVVSLLTPRAVLLPSSLVVPALPTGDAEVSIGNGALWFGDQRVRVRRWFTPPRVHRGSLAQLGGSRKEARRFVAGWRDRLGEGPGLTPYGDDVICGVMLGLLASDDADADRLARDIQETDLAAHTTAPSASLLRCASDGWCIPEVEQLVTALATHSPVQRAVLRLLGVGHSSGRGLLAGLSTVVDLDHPGVAA